MEPIKTPLKHELGQKKVSSGGRHGYTHPKMPSGDPKFFTTKEQENSGIRAVPFRNDGRMNPNLTISFKKQETSSKIDLFAKKGNPSQISQKGLTSSKKRSASSKYIEEFELSEEVGSRNPKNPKKPQFLSKLSELVQELNTYFKGITGQICMTRSDISDASRQSHAWELLKSQQSVSEVEGLFRRESFEIVAKKMEGYSQSRNLKDKNNLINQIQPKKAKNEKSQNFMMYSSQDPENEEEKEEGIKHSHESLTSEQHRQIFLKSSLDKKILDFDDFDLDLGHEGHVTAVDKELFEFANTKHSAEKEVYIRDQIEAENRNFGIEKITNLFKSSQHSRHLGADNGSQRSLVDSIVDKIRNSVDFGGIGNLAKKAKNEVDLELEQEKRKIDELRSNGGGSKGARWPENGVIGVGGGRASHRIAGSLSASSNRLSRTSGVSGGRDGNGTSDNMTSVLKKTQMGDIGNEASGGENDRFGEFETTNRRNRVGSLVVEAKNGENGQVLSRTSHVESRPKSGFEDRETLPLTKNVSAKTEMTPRKSKKSISSPKKNSKKSPKNQNLRQIETFYLKNLNNLDLDYPSLAKTAFESLPKVLDSRRCQFLKIVDKLQKIDSGIEQILSEFRSSNESNVQFMKALLKIEKEALEARKQIRLNLTQRDLKRAKSGTKRRQSTSKTPANPQKSPKSEESSEAATRNRMTILKYKMIETTLRDVEVKIELNFESEFDKELDPNHRKIENLRNRSKRILTLLWKWLNTLEKLALKLCSALKGNISAYNADMTLRPGERVRLLKEDSFGVFVEFLQKVTAIAHHCLELMAIFEKTEAILKKRVRVRGRRLKNFISCYLNYLKQSSLVTPSLNKAQKLLKKFDNVEINLTDFGEIRGLCEVPGVERGLDLARFRADFGRKVAVFESLENRVWVLFEGQWVIEGAPKHLIRTRTDRLVQDSAQKSPKSVGIGFLASRSREGSSALTRLFSRQKDIWVDFWLKDCTPNPPEGPEIDSELYKGELVFGELEDYFGKI